MREKNLMKKILIIGLALSLILLIGCSSEEEIDWTKVRPGTSTNGTDTWVYDKDSGDTIHYAEVCEVIEVDRWSDKEPMYQADSAGQVWVSYDGAKTWEIQDLDKKLDEISQKVYEEKKQGGVILNGNDLKNIDFFLSQKQKELSEDNSTISRYNEELITDLRRDISLVLSDFELKEGG